MESVTTRLSDSIHIRSLSATETYKYLGISEALGINIWSSFTDAFTGPYTGPMYVDLISARSLGTVSSVPIRETEGFVYVI